MPFIGQTATGVGDGVGDGDNVGEAVGEGDGVGDGEAVGDGVAVGDGAGVGSGVVLIIATDAPSATATTRSPPNANRAARVRRKCMREAS